MCGILAQYAFHRDRQLDSGLFSKALDSMVRRGPDDFGVFSAPGVLMGMRRLSIIDRAGGHQPLSNEDRKLQLVANGEIYNFRSLRADLLGKGHHFATLSDCEVLLHQYEELVLHRQGSDSAKFASYLNSINGMFGFALFDAGPRRLIVARDRMGIKPLYVLRAPDFIAFSSEIRPLTLLYPDAARPELGLLSEFLQVGYLLGRHSGYTGIQRVLPSEYYVVEDGVVDSRVYWTPRKIQAPGSDVSSFLRETFPAVVDDQLVADVSTGLFLSGGLDSALLANVVAKDLGRRTHCFTVSFDDRSHDESQLAALIAADCGLPLERISLGEISEGLVRECMSAFAEPLADTSALPTFVLSKKTAASAKVVLSGDGGDELFGGYPTHFLTGMHRYLRFLRHLPLDLVTERFTSDHKYLSLDARLKAFTRGLGNDPLLSHFGWKRLHDTEILRPGVTSIPWSSLLEPFRRQWIDFPSDDGILKAAWMDCMSFLPDSVLQKTDRVSMYHSQEARVPFLDNRVVDSALLAPARSRGSLLNTKKSVREVLRDKYRLPEVIWKKKKQGFTPPLSRWINGPLGEYFGHSLRKSLVQLEVFDIRVFDRILAEHRGFRHDHSRRLWALAAASRWLTGSH